MVKRDFEDTEINDILIVGDSETSFEFSMSLQSMDTFTRVIHVIRSADAVKLLVQEEFSVIVIDNDAPDVEAVTLSKLIRHNLPLSRIIIITSDYSVSLIKSLINEGSVDALIPLPIDSFSASSVIIEQYAKYQINQTLYDLVTIDPPKFSPQYYLLHDPSLSKKNTDDLQFLGIVINYSSITKFSKFYSEIFQVDEYLITGYISAISLLGQQLFEEKSYFKEINFGGLSVVMYTSEDLQFMFFFKDLTKQAYQGIESEIDQLLAKINLHYTDYLNTQNPIPDQIDEELEALSEQFFERHKKIIDYNRKQKIVIFGNQLPKLNTILAEKSEKYSITRIMKKNEVIDYLLHNEADMLIINQVLQEDTWNLTMASQAKDINPGIQIIAMLKELNNENLMKTLNDDYIDFVISYKDDVDEIERYIILAFNESLRIKAQLINYQPHNLQYSLHRSVVARSMLRTHHSSFQMSKIPEFYGIFILHEELPYYTKLWPISPERDIKFDDQLFAGFISSMELFTGELFDSNEEFSGFRFGDITILIKKHFSFSFIFFLGNIDHTNFLMIDKQLDHASGMLHDAIMNSEGFLDFDLEVEYDVTDLIENHLTKLFIRLSSLNFLD